MRKISKEEFERRMAEQRKNINQKTHSGGGKKALEKKIKDLDGRRKIARRAKTSAKGLLNEAREEQFSRYKPLENTDPLEVYDHKEKPTDVLRNTLRPLFTSRRAGFLCCGGPSYRDVDTSQLRSPGVPTIGINNTARDLDCDFAIFSDPAEKFHSSIMMDHKICKFVPLPRLSDYWRIKVGKEWFWAPYRVSDCPNVFAFRRNEDFRPETFLTTNSASWGVKKDAERKGNPWGSTLNTFLLGFRIAHYLGIRRLYLLGVDFKMSPDAEYAFAMESFNKTRHNCNTGTYERTKIWMNHLKPVFDEADFQVFNCNPTSGLETFEYVPYETAVQDCIGQCIQPPYDFVGHYDKIDREGDDSDPEELDRSQ